MPSRHHEHGHSPPLMAISSDDTPRISALLGALARAKEIIEQDCPGDGDDKLARISLVLMEKAVSGLVETCEILRPSGQSGRTESMRTISRPRLAISTEASEDRALQEASTAHTSLALADPRSAPPRPPSSMSHRHSSSHSSRHTKDDYAFDAPPSQRNNTSSRRPRSPVQEPSPPPRPSYPPLPKSRASSHRGSPITEVSARHETLSRRRDVSVERTTHAPIIEDQRRPVEQGNRRSRRDILSGTSDSEQSHTEDRRRSRAKSVSGKSSSRRRRDDAARWSIPEPSAPPFEPEPIALKGERILRSIARALMQQGDGLATVASLARLSKGSHIAVNSMLYGDIVLKSLGQVSKLDQTLESSSQLAALVRNIRIPPVDSASSVSDILPLLQSLLGHCPSILALTEDLSAGDWDVTSLQKDYLLPVAAPGSAPRLNTLISARCWWELSAIIALLVQSPSLATLKLAAAMDRDWSGSTFLAQPPLSPPSLLTALEIGQVMHEDTLACILRSTPHLRSLFIGFQSIGSTDDDTPIKSIPLALKHVAQSLIHLAIRAPSKKGDEDTGGLVDAVIAELPLLEILELEERADVKLASKDTLKTLPKRLKTLRGRRICSFGSSRVLDMLEGDGIPVLAELDLQWATVGGEGNEVYKSRHQARIEQECEEIGIKFRVGQSDEALMFKSEA